MIHPARLVALLLCLSTACVAAAGNGARSDGLRGIAIAAPRVPAGTVINPNLTAFEVRMLEDLPPQLRAERALAMAVNNRNGAALYVTAHAQEWRGRIEAGDRLNAITLSAMNSPRLDVRNAGFEVQLAMDGLAKTPATVEHLIQRLHEDPHGVGAWELWHLGVMGARDIQRERIFDVLVATSRSKDDALRGWAVEALALFGGAEAIDPLIRIAANDRAPSIRENAFCALAQSGNFRQQERQRAIPGLFAIVNDPRTDPQAIAWSDRALREITGIDDLPDDPGRLRARLQFLGWLPDR